MRLRCRRNFLRGAVRRAFYRAWRQGERYCWTCGSYHAPHRFSGSDPRTCDHCRGLHHCPRCQEDQPETEFGDGTEITAEDMCRTCRSYRPLTGHERATLDAFLAAHQPAESANAAEGVTLGRDLGGRLVRLQPGLRHRHLYLIGKPGTGKATLMKNLIIQDMVAGRGCAVLDLHGDPPPTLIRPLLDRLVWLEGHSRKAGSDPRLARLSTRQREILTHVARGQTNKEIAGDLHVEEQTIKNHLGRVLRKLSVHTRADAVRAWVGSVGRHRGPGRAA